MQTDCQPTSPSLSTYEPLDLARLKRGHGMHRAAQVLADASRCRAGLPPQPLALLEADEREWFKQAARNCIEIFETVTIDREPDAVQARRQTRQEQLAVALENRLAIERSTAAVRAAERGHELGPWHCDGPDIGRGIERALCLRCKRLAGINVGDDPVLSGPALTEGCLTAADKETP